MTYKDRMKDLSYENIFCIRENGQWVSGVYHTGRTIKPISDKSKNLALARLANELFLMIRI
jgi:hypothetical protein